MSLANDALRLLVCRSSHQQQENIDGIDCSNEDNEGYNDDDKGYNDDDEGYNYDEEGYKDNEDEENCGRYDRDIDEDFNLW